MSHELRTWMLVRDGIVLGALAVSLRANGLPFSGRDLGLFLGRLPEMGDGVRGTLHALNG